MRRDAGSVRLEIHASEEGRVRCFFTFDENSNDSMHIKAMDIALAKALESSVAHLDSVDGLLSIVSICSGRNAVSTAEFSLMLKRYTAEVTGSEAGSIFLHANVEVSGTETKSIAAEFRISPSYPFSPIDVFLECRQGSVDVGRLQRVLVKNAKPGFGYLSRTMEFVSAALHGA